MHDVGGLGGVLVKGMSRMSSTAPFLVLGEMDTCMEFHALLHRHARARARIHALWITLPATVLTSYGLYHSSNNHACTA